MPLICLRSFQDSVGLRVHSVPTCYVYARQCTISVPHITHLCARRHISDSAPRGAPPSVLEGAFFDLPAT